MIPPIAALLSWPVISAILVSRFRLPVAILVVMVAGYLLLPETIAIDLPVLPSLDKHSIPVISALVIGMLLARQGAPGQALAGVLPRSWMVRILLMAMIFGTFGTVYTNPDNIIEGTQLQPALRLYDGFSMAMNMVMLVLPLLLGRKFFFASDGHRLLLVGICIAACLYTLPALYEVRMSPQLNRTFYGFFAHDWRQHIRGDGFRPVVFLQHGLHLALFLCIATLAAGGIIRLGNNYRMGFWAMLWLLLALVLAKSLGALMIAIILLPAAVLMPTRAQLLVAAVIGTIALSYPVLRGAHLVPLDQISSFATSVSPDRARSLNVRIENEEQLLGRAQLRPVFGWGGYGRARIRDDRGRDQTIADGYWIIILGVGGWVRYIGEFGLMTVPPLLLFLRRRKLGITSETAVLSLMLSAMMVDALPNSGITPITWLIAGALWGRLEFKGQTTGPDVPVRASHERGHATYTRDFKHDHPTRRPPPGRSSAKNPVHTRSGRYGGP